jgi:hypothetical protein
MTPITSLLTAAPVTPTSNCDAARDSGASYVVPVTPVTSLLRASEELT